MSTISHKPIIKTMLENDGIYSDDPRVFAIYEYQNTFDGAPAWKLCYNERGEQVFLSTGHYQDVPKPLFRGGCLTTDGQKWLKDNAQL